MVNNIATRRKRLKIRTAAVIVALILIVLGLEAKYKPVVIEKPLDFKLIK
ncbi:MAG: hypothetical protein AAF153_03430 [Pseudomonadota bacterium]